MFNLHHWLILHGRYTCVARNHKCGSCCSKTKTCQDLQHKFQELIKAYNLGAYTAEEFFNRLKAFITELEHEDKRTVREGLTEEELAVYDLMIQKAALTEKERNQIKEIANELTDKMKEILVIDWRKKQRTRHEGNHFLP
jgi:type I restriction enzyme, R subunit